MRRLISRIAAPLLLSIFLSSGVPGTLFAQETPKKSPEADELDEVLQGFDEQPDNAKGNEELDEVLEGFEDEPGTTKEGKDLDDILQGFEEEKGAEEEITKVEEPKSPPFGHLNGVLGLGISYAFAHDAPEPGEPDYRGLNRLRPWLDLELDFVLSKNWRGLINGHVFYDFAYAIKGRELFTNAVLDLYEEEAEIDEAFLQGVLLSDLDLKVGRQVVVWGRSDNIRVVDILNPLDFREPGLVYIEDLRLPVFMTRLDYYFGQWNLSGIAVNEIRFSKNPVFNAEFFPFDMPLPPEEKPANTLENTQFGFALNGIFSGWDISFYAARFFDDQAHLEMVSPTQPVRRHSRLSMVGAGFNVARGNWLLKSETAFFDGLEFLVLPGETKSRLDVMVGLEYSGFNDTLLSLEVVNRHLFDFDPALKGLTDGTRENEFQAVFRYNGDFFHDRLHLVFLASMFGITGDGGGFQRLSAEYEVFDAFSITGGVVTYQSGDRPFFRKIGENDRFFMETRYFF